jgi:hyperosmotically inducible periplasmic protein
MNPNKTRTWSRLVAWPLCAALATMVGTTSAIADPSDDETMAAKIQQKLSRKDLDGVQVDVEGGVATLTGTVATLRQKQVASRIAGDVEGIQEVQDLAGVLWAGRTTDEIAMDVQRALADPSFHTIFDWVQAEVHGRSVVLSGWVTMPWKADAARDRMMRIAGVDAVEAKIEVLPVSIFDDEIRLQTARRLYGSLTFFDQGSRLNPPVHIVVRQGEVILMGEVRNEAERMLARSLVSSAALPLRIVNQLRWPGDGRS